MPSFDQRRCHVHVVACLVEMAPHDVPQYGVILYQKHAHQLSFSFHLLSPFLCMHACDKYVFLRSDEVSFCSGLGSYKENVACPKEMLVEGLAKTFKAGTGCERSGDHVRLQNLTKTTARYQHISEFARFDALAIPESVF